MGTCDNYGVGVAGAQKLADHLGGSGKVAILKWPESLYHVDARAQAAQDTFAKYPGIEVAAVQGVTSAETAATATEAILTAHPDIAGIWCFWDSPAMGAVGVIESQQKNVKVAACDLSTDSAYSIATGGAMLAIGAQHPYDQGVAEALIGIAALAGVDTPAFVEVPGEVVTRESLAQSYPRIFKTDLPDNIAAALAE